MKKKYYLYHIPGKKIGMTCNIYSRVILQQGYKPGEFQILESSEDQDFIESKEKEWQKFFNYKKDLNSYTIAKNSPINQFKSNKIMRINVTEQTATFPVPVNKLKGCLMDNIGVKFSTNYGDYNITPELVKILVDNARESMFRSTSCYIYNKVLFEEAKKLENNAKNKLKPKKSKNKTENQPEANTKEIPNVYDLIRDWADDKGIYAKGDSKTQYIKLQEESGELARAILKKNKLELIDAIGDMVVVLTNLAALEGLKIEDCVTSAYDVIKSRQGSMINGTFVKENSPTITPTDYKTNPSEYKLMKTL